MSLFRFFSDLASSEPHRLYRALGDRNTLCDRKKYANLGYWRDGAKDLDEAGDALADLVAREARLGKSDEVLDVGFGFGDQDLFWMERYQPKRIVGVNVTSEQVEVARRRVDEAGFGNRIDLRIGSATSLPFSEASFDVVTAVECAFHFDSRADFLREAFRVLRPGGRIVLADLALPEHALSWRERMELLLAKGFWKIPKANLVSRGDYLAEVTHVGFGSVQWNSIWKDVHPPFLRFAAKKLRDPAVIARMNPWLRRSMERRTKRVPERPSPLDYVLVSARKP